MVSKTVERLFCYGVVPIDWCDACITTVHVDYCACVFPVHREDDKCEYSNWRGISLLVYCSWQADL